FQAEDGIRDRNVTGVQTCALPILYDDQKELFAYICMQHDITYKKTSGNIQGKSSSSSTNDIYSSMISFVNPDGIIEKPKINSPSIKTINSKVGQQAIDFIVEEDKAKDFQCFRNAMKGNIENVQIRIIQGNEETLELDVIYIPS